jgi:uncharacterized protein (DUF111 family)
MRICKTKKMTTAVITTTRITMNLIHHHHHHQQHFETIIHKIQNEEPVDSDLHTYSNKNNVPTDWKNKKINYDL